MLENFPLEVDIAAPPKPNPVRTLEEFPTETSVVLRVAAPGTESVPKHSPSMLVRRSHAPSIVTVALIVGGIFLIWHLNQGAPVARIATARPPAQPAASEIAREFTPGPASVTTMPPSAAPEVSGAAPAPLGVPELDEEPSRTEPRSTASNAAVERRSSVPIQASPPPPPVAPPVPPVQESAVVTAVPAVPTAVVDSRPIVGLDSSSTTSVTAPEPERASVWADMDPLLYERAAVRALLERYRAAYERLDARAAKRVWPGADERALERAFSGLERQTVNFDACDIDISNARGRALCRGSASYTPRVGKRDERTQGRNWTFVIQKAGGDWRIESVRAQ